MSHDPPSQDDFEAAFDEAVPRLRAAVRAACAAQTDWTQRIAAAIYAVLDFAVADPAAIRVLTRDSLLHRPSGPLRYLELIDAFAALLAAEVPDDPQLPALIEQALVGAIAITIGDHIRDGRPARLREAGPELVELSLQPYLGREQARLAARALPD
jgi:hypothetical protein